MPAYGNVALQDPKRRMCAPPPSQMLAAKRTGTLAYHYVLSDDGNSALVEFVALNRTVFQTLFAGAQPSAVKTFAPGAATAAEVQAQFRKLRKGFSFGQFILRMR